MSDNPQPWMTEYPTLATVLAAGLQTLASWDQHLPPPQTDVQRALRRRLKQRLNELLSLELREKAPEIADKMNELYARLEKITGVRAPRF